MGLRIAYVLALAAWFSGIVTTCGGMGREIEYRQGMGW
jgi:hypothetical protein